MFHRPKSLNHGKQKEHTNEYLDQINIGPRLHRLCNVAVCHRLRRAQRTSSPQIPTQQVTLCSPAASRRTPGEPKPHYRFEPPPRQWPQTCEECYRFRPRPTGVFKKLSIRGPAKGTVPPGQFELRGVLSDRRPCSTPRSFIGWGIFTLRTTVWPPSTPSKKPSPRSSAAGSRIPRKLSSVKVLENMLGLVYVAKKSDVLNHVSFPIHPDSARQIQS